MFNNYDIEFQRNCAIKYVHNLNLKYKENKYVAVIINKRFTKTLIYTFKLENNYIIPINFNTNKPENLKFNKDVEYNTLINLNKFITMSKIRSIINNIAYQNKCYLSYKNDYYYKDGWWYSVDTDKKLVISNKISPLEKRLNKINELIEKYTFQKNKYLDNITHKYVKTYIYKNYHNKINKLNEKLIKLHQEKQLYIQL